MEKLSVLILTLVTILTCNAQNHELYDLKTPMESRSISFENPDGKPGSGGKAANKQLGPGRKGASFKPLTKIPNAEERIKDLDELHNSNKSK